MNVRIESDLTGFVEEQVKAGRYATAEAVVNAAVARLRDEEALLSADASDDLAAIEEGLAQAGRGEVRPWEEVRAELRAKLNGK